MVSVIVSETDVILSTCLDKKGILNFNLEMPLISIECMCQNTYRVNNNSNKVKNNIRFGRIS